MDSTYTYFYRALELLRSDKPEAEKEIEQLLEKSKELFKNGKNGSKKGVEEHILLTSIVDGYKHKLTDNKHILGERFGQNSLTRSQLSKAAVALNQSREKVIFIYLFNLTNQLHFRSKLL